MKNSDPANTLCAKEIVVLIRTKRDIKAAEILVVLQAHQRSQPQAVKVGALVNARLHSAKVSKEDKIKVMREVRTAIDQHHRPT